MDRIEQLQTWRLPASLLAIARGELPHPAFQAKCQPIRFALGRDQFGLDLKTVQQVGPSGKRPAVAMWENLFGDGHSCEIMFCEHADGRNEFWNVWYADDTDGPDPELVARSEQGLYFWLFFYLIPVQYFRSATNQEAFDTLSAAAESVGFSYLDEAMKFEEEFGSAEGSRRLIRERSVSVAD